MFPLGGQRQVVEGCVLSRKRGSLLRSKSGMCAKTGRGQGTSRGKHEAGECFMERESTLELYSQLAC